MVPDSTALIGGARIYGARCHCGRFVADLTVTYLGYRSDEGFEPEVVKAVRGTCKRHGDVEAVGYDVWWLGESW